MAHGDEPRTGPDPAVVRSDSVIGKSGAESESDEASRQGRAGQGKVCGRSLKRG